jgi:hypothetical protein
VNTRAALIFICGSGISANAYAPLVRRIADAGYAVFVVKLPYILEAVPAGVLGPRQQREAASLSC